MTDQTVCRHVEEDVDALERVDHVLLGTLRKIIEIVAGLPQTGIGYWRKLEDKIRTSGKQTFFVILTRSFLWTLSKGNGIID